MEFFSWKYANSFLQPSKADCLNITLNKFPIIKASSARQTLDVDSTFRWTSPNDEYTFKRAL